MTWWKNWKERHQNPLNLGLHLLGIPMTIAALPLVIYQLIHWQWGLWWRPAVLFAGGYVLQWLGHRIEGNTMGELILIRKWRNQPYIAVAPQYRFRDADAGAGHASSSPGGPSENNPVQPPNS